jgi:septal ring factor EnvC (AmiA/AmiB activator)
VERDLSAQREALGAQLRLAHRLDRTGPLQFLLSQPDPMRAGRMLNFYGYFGRARAGQIAAIRERVQRIDVLDVQLEAAEAHLIKLTEERQQQLATFEDQRSARATVLAALNRDAQDKKQMLARLKSQQAELETLLRDLTRALRDSPPPPQVSGPFASLRGKLTWPAAGSLLARFGQQRATGVKWEGILLATVRAAAVRAVAPGRVVYADWLPGLGLLTIIDHGNGYMSLYGHNDTLRSAAGNLVRAGDVIADSGDTGGSSRPVLYFEIRQSGRPVDPLPWFTSARPN